MRWGITLAILTLLYGLCIGLAFGAAEESMKKRLSDSAQAVAESVYQNDSARMKPVLDKSWTYMKRAHLHAGSMGTAALALSFLLAYCAASNRLRGITSFALGAGGLLYSIYWMWAGFRAPGMGGTHQARESLDWLAIPSSGMFVFATIAVLVVFLLSTFRSQKRDAETPSPKVQEELANPILVEAGTVPADAGTIS